MTLIKYHKDLKVYQEAFSAAMKIFEITKSFPAEEKYSLTSQIRRSSRSVCGNLAEGWRKSTNCLKINSLMRTEKQPKPKIGLILL